MLRQDSTTLRVQPPLQGLHEITGEIVQWVTDTGVSTGLLTLFCRHTSAYLLIQENAAPAARRDLEAFFARIAPEGSTDYTHDDEGPDDMPAHLRTALTHTSLSIPVHGGHMLLGTWQGVFLFEHRRQPHQRSIVLHIIGE